MQEKLCNLYAYLTSHQQISAAWLFGSVAKGTNGPNSDIDIAVLMTAGIASEQRFDLRLELMDRAEEICQEKVDVIDMESAPLYLQHQIRKTDYLVVEKDKSRRVQFDVKSRREYFDFKPVMDYRTKRLLENYAAESEV